MQIISVASYLSLCARKRPNSLIDAEDDEKMHQDIHCEESGRASVVLVTAVN